MTHILVLEDDLSMRSLLKTLLEIEKFQVSTIETQNETEIVTQVSRLHPDIIFMDVNLKEISGIDILKRIRADSSISNIQIVMTSGEDLKRPCLAAGADDFFLKPYMPSDLISRLRALANTPRSGAIH